ncbi:tetratricopeptide repeat protein [Camelliibacillus cellulosilyticus]|uniref:Tetratricopeptide repeat protein n=1 Tax=Camelliibacillus cellulosilyticus TaxID=2174486 RepID=A0ABV9GMF6_9BACL
MSRFNDDGLEYMKAKDYEKAANAFNQAIEADPQDPVGFTNFGNLLIAIHESERALAFFDKAITLDENYGAAYYGYGNALYELERYEQAIDRFGQAEKCGITGADLHFMIGMAYTHLDRQMMALVHLQRAVELNEGDISARFQYALCLAKLGQVDLSVQQLNIVLDMDPKHADAYYNLGVALTYREAYQEAEACFKKALEIQKDHLLAANGLKMLKDRELAKS